MPLCVDALLPTTEPALRAFVASAAADPSYVEGMLPRLRIASLLVALAACGGPVLQNAPRPNPAAVAGIAAATAAAITLAAPDATARNAENVQRSGQIDRDVQAGSHETAPVEVLDRLDAQQPAPTPPPAPITPQPTLYELVAIPLLRPR